MDKTDDSQMKPARRRPRRRAPDIKGLDSDESRLVIELLRVLISDDHGSEIIVCGGGASDFKGLGEPWQREDGDRIHITAARLIKRRIFRLQYGDEHRPEGYQGETPDKSQIWYTFSPDLMDLTAVGFDNYMERLADDLRPYLDALSTMDLLQYALRQTAIYLDCNL